MILTAHLLAGATIASKISNPLWALPLAFLTHYLLDTLPHAEYPKENIENKQWRKSLPDFIKIGADFFTGIFLIFIFSQNKPVIYLGALLAVLPDAFTFLGIILHNSFLKHNDDFHKKIHFFNSLKKIPAFWGFLSQIIIIIAAICLL